MRERENGSGAKRSKRGEERGEATKNGKIRGRKEEDCRGRGTKEGRDGKKIEIGKINRARDEEILEDLKQLQIQKARLEGRLEERTELGRITRDEIMTVRDGFVEERRVEREALLNEYGREIREGMEGTLQARTFAEVTAPNIMAVRGPVQPAPKVVMIKKEGSESGVVKNKVKELTVPKVESISVQRVKEFKRRNQY